MKVFSIKYSDRMLLHHIHKTYDIIEIKVSKSSVTVYPSIEELHLAANSEDTLTNDYELLVIITKDFQFKI